MKYLFINDDVIEMVATGDSHDVRLSSSEADIWTSMARGQEKVRIKDTGNNIKLTIGEKKIKLNYAEFCDLFTAMSVKMVEDPDMWGGYEEILEIKTND